MSNPKQVKLDTIAGSKYIEQVASEFKKSMEGVTPPDCWNNDQSLDFYRGQFMGIGIGIALTGLSRLGKTEEATMEELLSELNFVYGELACKISGKTHSKIITL